VCSCAIAEFAKAAADKPDAPKPKENEFKPDDKIVTEPVTFEYLRKAGITDDILDIILTAPLEVTGTDGKTLKGGGIHFKVVMAMRRRGLSTAVIKAAYRLGKLGTTAASATRGFDGYLDKTIAAADEKIGVIVSNDDHMERAEIFVAHVRKNLKSYKGDFVDYKDGRYVEAAPDTIDADERTFLRKCSVAVSDGKGGS
jgi:hypothetical protein